MNSLKKGLGPIKAYNGMALKLSNFFAKINFLHSTMGLYSGVYIIRDVGLNQKSNW